MSIDGTEISGAKTLHVALVELRSSAGPANPKVQKLRAVPAGQVQKRWRLGWSLDTPGFNLIIDEHCRYTVYYTYFTVGFGRSCCLIAVNSEISRSSYHERKTPYIQVHWEPAHSMISTSKPKANKTMREKRSNIPPLLAPALDPRSVLT